MGNTNVCCPIPWDVSDGNNIPMDKPANRRERTTNSPVGGANPSTHFNPVFGSVPHKQHTTDRYVGY